MTEQKQQEEVKQNQEPTHVGVPVENFNELKEYLRKKGQEGTLGYDVGDDIWNLVSKNLINVTHIPKEVNKEEK